MSSPTTTITNNNSNTFINNNINNSSSSSKESRSYPFANLFNIKNPEKRGDRWKFLVHNTQHKLNELIQSNEELTRFTERCFSEIEEELATRREEFDREMAKARAELDQQLQEIEEEKKRILAEKEEIERDKKIIRAEKALEERKAEFEREMREQKARFEEQLENEREQLRAEREALEEERRRMEGVIAIQKSKVKLDVGGKKYSTSLQTLTRYPDSMLGTMFSGRYPIEQDEDGTYFIDRDGKSFRYIISFLRDDKVSLPTEEYKLRQLLQEVNYYQIEPLEELIQVKLGIAPFRVHPLALKFAWSQTCKGSKLKFENNGTTLICDTQDTYVSWYTTRSEVPLQVDNQYYWEVRFEQFKPTKNSWEIVVGVVSHEFLAFENPHLLVGYGAASGYGYAFKSGEKISKNKAEPYGQNSQVGDVVGVLVDLKNKSISFYKNGQSQGVAYTGIDTSVPLYPAASCICDCKLSLVQDVKPPHHKATQ
eukprot:GEZU01024960.1.p1 GENE.GEZU01024960.1~~GEZU01024960.1.p1  ORF type:complete len:483 (+),score=114.94 GEZU01024960.1:153-1601(+)